MPFFECIENFFKILYESYTAKSICASISFIVGWITLYLSIKNSSLQILKSEQDIFDKLEASIKEYKELGLEIIQKQESEQDVSCLIEKQNSLEEDLLNRLEFICFNVNRGRISKKYFIEMHYNLLDYVKDNFKEIKEKDGTSEYIEIRKLLYKNHKKIEQLIQTNNEIIFKN